MDRILAYRVFFCNKMLRVNRVVREPPGVRSNLEAPRGGHSRSMKVSETSHIVQESMVGLPPDLPVGWIAEVPCQLSASK